MKAKMNIRSILLIAIICFSGLFFINMSFAANTAKVIVETANIREQPSSDSKILELASQGEEVEIIEKTGDWYKIKYKKITGYLRSDLIKLKEENNNKTNSTQVNTQIENIVETNTTETNTQTENVVETSTQPENTVVQENENKTETVKTKKAIKTLKLKITPLINSLEIAELNVNEEVEIKETINDWALVTSTTGKQGWVRVDNLADIEKKEEKVSTNETQTTTKQQTSRSSMNERTTTTKKETTQTTSKVETQSKTQTETQTETQKQTTVTESKVTSGKGSEVVAYAKTLLGCKYVYGGTTTNGFDCSGFTQYVYKHFGINLNRTAAAQYSNGSSVTNLQAGDLVMFGKSGINHVGIYIGGNTFIHAANPGKGVTTDTLSTGYYKTNYVGARRIF